MPRQRGLLSELSMSGLFDFFCLNWEKTLIEWCISHKDSLLASMLLVLLYTGMRVGKLKTATVDRGYTTYSLNICLSNWKVRLRGIKTKKGQTGNFGLPFFMLSHQFSFFGARGRTWTGTVFLPRDFKSLAAPQKSLVFTDFCPFFA